MGEIIGLKEERRRWVWVLGKGDMWFIRLEGVLKEMIGNYVWRVYVSGFLEKFEREEIGNG